MCAMTEIHSMAVVCWPVSEATSPLTGLLCLQQLSAQLPCGRELAELWIVGNGIALQAALF